MKKRFLSLISALVFLAMLLPVSALGAGETISAGSYGDGLVKFVSNKKVGYMDIFGNIVIKASYMSGNPFRNGLAMVQVSGGGYAKDQFINKAGKVIVTAPKRTKDRYYGLCDIWDVDYATVEIWSISKKDGSISPVGYNYINEKGKMLNTQEYQFAGAFVEGYALVGTGYASKKPTRSSISGRNEHWLAVFNGNTSTNVATNYYYIDKNGEQLGSMTWSMGRSFCNGLAAVAIKAGNALSWGFINTSGTLQISPEYASVGDYKNGMIWVSDGENYGYIDEMGNVLIPLKWKQASDFSAEGYAVVKDDYYAKIIDRQGNIVLDTEYNNLYAVEGTDRYRADDGVVRGLIDRAGNILVSLSYRYTGANSSFFYGTRYADTLMICNEFGDVITPVLVNGSVLSGDDAAAYPDGTPVTKYPFSAGEEGKSLNLCTFIDAAGNTLSMNIIDDMRGEAFTLVRSNGKTVLFDLDGNKLGQNEWDGVSSSVSNENVICVKKGEFYGFIDAHTGSILVPPQYTEVSVYADGVIGAMVGKNPNYLDSHARVILPEITKKSKKDVIIVLQEQLASLGYYSGKINGGFSKQLTTAITDAQTALGLEPTGIVDSDFQYMLKDALQANN